MVPLADGCAHVGVGAGQVFDLHVRVGDGERVVPVALGQPGGREAQRPHGQGDAVDQVQSRPYGQQADTADGQQEPGDEAVAHVVVGGPQKSDVNHADRLAGRVSQGAVGAQVPGVHDQGLARVVHPLLKDDAPDGFRNFGADGPCPVVGEDVGGNAHLILENGHGAARLAVVIGLAEHRGAQPVDQVVVEVQHPAAVKKRLHPPVALKDREGDPPHERGPADRLAARVAVVNQDGVLEGRPALELKSLRVQQHGPPGQAALQRLAQHRVAAQRYALHRCGVAAGQRPAFGVAEVENGEIELAPDGGKDFGGSVGGADPAGGDLERVGQTSQLVAVARHHDLQILVDARLGLAAHALADVMHPHEPDHRGRDEGQREHACDENGSERHRRTVGSITWRTAAAAAAE